MRCLEDGMVRLTRGPVRTTFLASPTTWSSLLLLLAADVALLSYAYLAPVGFLRWSQLEVVGVDMLLLSIVT